jgi:DNA-binding transcriptional LysR family regulator
MLDLNQIYLFVEVVRAGSFAEAARRLSMPANTISRHIQQLEDELKNRLFFRTTRKLTLTAVGQDLYAQCAENVEALVVASQQAADTESEPSGPLRVSLNADFFSILPISWVSDFLTTYPGINLEFVIDNAYVDLISSGVDVAFRPEDLLDENATRRVLTTTRRRFVAAPQYLQARGAPTCLEDLAHHCCLLVSRDSGPITWRANGPEGRAEVQVRGPLLASTIGVIKDATLHGLGIALLPDLIVNEHIKDGRLVSVLDQYTTDSTKFCAVFPNHRHIRRAATLFVESVRSRLDALQGR